jgi:hypothetical protein
MVLDHNGQPLQPQQPQFPVTGINIPSDGSGMAITVVLAPGFQFNITLGEDMMNQITKQWVQTRKSIADQLRVIQHVNSSKN